MRKPWKRVLMVALAAAFAAAFSNAAAAKQKKHRATQPSETARSNDLGIQVDEDGMPIIMQGYHRRRAAPAETAHRADRPVKIPRGGSSYVDIPPVNPSPYSANSPPARALTQPTVQPYNPPPITTFGDRVNSAIHSYPLERGIGNNPTDQQMFIRQRANGQ